MLFVTEVSTDPMLLIGECRIVILRLLVHCINFPAPNLSHFLLGFDVKRSPSTCNLQVSICIWD